MPRFFFVISLGAIGFLPKICSAVSLRPAKLIAYPPNAGFFAFDLVAFFLVAVFFFGATFLLVAVFFFGATFLFRFLFCSQFTCNFILN